MILFPCTTSREVFLAEPWLQHFPVSRMSRAQLRLRPGKTFPIASVRSSLPHYICCSLTDSTTARGRPTPVKIIHTVPVDGKTWYGGIFYMGGINRLAVHHTWSLFKRSQSLYPEKAYGDNFSYSEITAKPRYHQAVLYVFAVSAFIAGILFPPVSLPNCWPIYIRSNVFEDAVDSQAYLTKTWYWAHSVHTSSPPSRTAWLTTPHHLGRVTSWPRTFHTPVHPQ